MMDIKWLDDYMTLVECGNFTRAAERRFVTQPAFSRRIKSLENWLGVELVNRNAYPMKLTAIGSDYVEPIRKLLKDTYDLRTEIQERAGRGERIIVSTQHSLSVSFCPKWYGMISPYLGNNRIRINAGNLYDSLDAFLAKQSEFLLCYSTPDILPQLERHDLRCLKLGQEQLVPVTTVTDEGRPLFELTDIGVLPMVGYPPQSFFGDMILKECISDPIDDIKYDVVYETALSEGIKNMVLQGVGMAWLPIGIIEKELNDGNIMIIDDLPKVDLQVMLYTHKTNKSPMISEFWQCLIEMNK